MYKTIFQKNWIYCLIKKLNNYVVIINIYDTYSINLFEKIFYIIIKRNKLKSALAN